MTVTPASETSDETVLEVRNLRVSFTQPEHEVLKDVSFSVRRGQITALVGESGSGKSTTANAILRLLPESARITGGSILFGGKDLTAATEGELRDLRGREIGYVPQDPFSGLDPLQTIAVQVGESVRAHFRTSRLEVRAKVESSLKDSGLEISAGDRFPHQLSGGMKQRGLIASSVINHPRMIIADEPTSALDPTVQRTILERLGELSRSKGIALLLVTHNLSLAAEWADWLVVMRRGEVVEQGACGQLWFHPGSSYTRDLIDANPGSQGFLSLRQVRDELAPPRDQPALLEASLVSKHYHGRKEPALVDVSLALRGGRITGLIGESGSGKTTLGSLFLRFLKPSAGRITFQGDDIHELTGDRLAAYHRNVQAIFQNPYASLNPRFTVKQVLAEPLRAFFRDDKGSWERRIAAVLDEVALASNLVNRHPGELSGGQCQRVAIARALISRPKLIVCDEAVSALDVLVQEQIVELLIELKRELGLGLLFISHDLALVKAFADDVTVLAKGRVEESGGAASVFSNPGSDVTRALLDSLPKIPAPRG